MRLYHGTTGAVARIALTEGLRCRRDTRAKTNWPECPSAEDRIYLTSVYAPYFAFSAQSMALPEQEWGIVEIETDRVNEWSLIPDEDFLEQYTRIMSAHDHEDFYSRLAESERRVLLQGNVTARTGWFRDYAEHFGSMWRDSVAELGTCAILYGVPVEAITRVSLMKPSHANGVLVWLASDPQITLLNHRLMREKYAVLTKWFMGMPVTLGEWKIALGPMYGSPGEKEEQEFARLLQDNSGVLVILR